MSTREQMSAKITRLLDYAAGHAEGFDYTDVERDLSWARMEFYKIVNRARKRLADDELNLICEPTGNRGPWIYRLVGNLAGTNRWSANRLGDAEERLVTIHAIARSTVQATDGRTHDGRRARIIDKSLRRLLEDLGELRSLDGAA